MFTQLKLADSNGEFGLISRIRQLADKRGSQYLNDPEITALIKDTFDLLFMELVEANEGYFVKETDPITPINDNQLPLPDDLYKIRLVKNTTCDRVIDEKTLREVQGLDSNFYAYYGTNTNYGYVLFSNHIRVFPKDSTRGSKFQIVYARDPLSLANETLQKGWEKFLIYKVAYTIGAIEDNPKVALADLAKQWEEKIKEFAAERDSSPKQVVDLERHTWY